MSRRKAMLNIGSKSLNRNTPDRETSKNGSGLGLLSAYSQNIDSGFSHHDDSDSDDEKMLPKSTLDSKVANFLKEIDDLDATIPSGSSKVKKKEKLKVEKSSSSPSLDSNEFITWGSWQQCIDENTQHPYYWNTTTNEVTWTVPEEIAVQYQQITDNKSSSNEEKNKLSDKEPVNVKPFKSQQKSDKKKEQQRTIHKDEFAVTKKLPEKSEKTSSKIVSAPEESLKVDTQTDVSSPKVNDFGLNDEEEVQVPQKRIKLTEKDAKDLDVPSLRKRNLSNEEEVEEKNDVTQDNVGKSIDAETDVKSTSEESDSNEESQIEAEFNTLSSKFDCLETNKSSIPLLHELLVEVEIRLDDWKAGAVSLQYVKQKLDKVNDRLADYEKTVMPAGWLCHWDSRYNRYYYTNKHGRTQWDFPVAEKNTSKQSSNDKSSSSNEASQGTSTAAAASSTESTTDDAKSPPQQTDTKDTSTLPSGNFPSGMMNYNSFNMQNYYWNMPNFGVRFGGQFRPPGFNNSFPNSPIGPDHPQPPGEEAAPLPPTPEEEPPPPPPPPNETDEPLSPPPPPPPPPSDGGCPVSPDEVVMEEGDDGIEMEISDVEEESNDQAPSKAENSPIAQLKGAPVEYSSAPQPPSTITLPAPPPQLFASASSLPPEKFKKIKKTKKDKGPLKKPPKQMYGMVAKWQKAKQEMEEEEERLILESEQELNHEGNIQQRIEKWKMDQMQSGKAATNANFQPVSDDWKKRVKSRKNKVT